MNDPQTQELPAVTSRYAQFAAMNVNNHVEKKNGLSYLSWAWAVDQLMRADPNAEWEFREWDGKPVLLLPDHTALVHCTVTAFGKARATFLPVMDHRNKAIQSPDAFAINTAMQRCLVKAIALHGMGLYIYAGEDLPPTVEGDKSEPPTPWTKELKDLASEAADKGLKAYQEFWEGLSKEARSVLVQTKEHGDFKTDAQKADAGRMKRAA